MELIDRQEVVNLICDSKDLKELFDRVYDEIPIIDIRPKGEWIGIGYDGYADGNPVYDEWECSNCGHEIKTEDTPPYCEICGADMREERADGTD